MSVPRGAALQVQCKFVYVATGDKMIEHARELARHFESQGTPVMIGAAAVVVVAVVVAAAVVVVVVVVLVVVVAVAVLVCGGGGGGVGDDGGRGVQAAVSSPSRASGCASTRTAGMPNF
jgi:hypothetical protein